MNGDEVTYVVTRNIQYTNVCYFRCGFCAFSKGKLAANLRGEPYLVPHEEIVRRGVEAWERGATEVCLQGGIHPAFDGDYYVSVVRAIKDAVPGAARARVQRARDLAGRRDARRPARATTSSGSATRGSPRCPAPRPRCSTTRCAPSSAPTRSRPRSGSRCTAPRTSVGLRSNNTIMFGHVDGPRNWARHLRRRPRPPARDGRLHRVRPAAVRAHGGADLPEGPRAAGADVRRGAADARRRAARAASRGSRTSRSPGSRRARRASPRRCAPASTTSAER